MAINHNWCNEYCIERMVTLFLRDAHTLRRWLLTEDVRFVLAGDEPVSDGEGVKATTYLDRFDAMLHRSTNWSFAALRSFLRHVQSMHATHRPPMTLTSPSPPSPSSVSDPITDASCDVPIYTHEDVDRLIARLLDAVAEAEAAVMSDIARSCETCAA